MHIQYSPLRFACRSAATVAFAAAAALGAQAQQNSGPATETVSQVQTASAPVLMAANNTSESIGYSSSAGAPEAEAATNFIAAPGMSAAMQPPPRRYGRRPVYADSSHNADGSSKYTFFGGAGFTLPTGGTHEYFSPSYDFQVGGGRNFNKKVALLAEFDWHNFGLQDSLTNALESSTGIYGELGVPQVNGHGHIWSFTLDPMYTYMDHEKIGGYVIGGVGFYHKITDFTTPAVGTYCDPYYGCYQYTADQTFDSYVSNAVGYNGGLGFTYKASRFSDLKFYAEARYVYTNNSRRPYYDGSTGANPTSNANYFNVFTQNSAPTTYIPITVGVRF